MSRIHQTETVIDGPIEAVWETLLDVARHSEWSDSFVLYGAPAEGGRGRVGFWAFGRALTHPIIFEVVHPPRRLEWRGGPRRLVSGRHYFELEPVDTDGARTRFVHGEEFSGVAVDVLWPALMKVLGPSYGRFNEQLKRRVEEAMGSR